MDSLAFLERADKALVQPVYVLPGDELFLKRQVKSALRKLVLGEDESGFGESSHDGDSVTYGEVISDVQTIGLLSARRLVIVEDADPFVTRERARLEKYVANPSSAGVLVLEVSSWASNTRLAKLVPDAGTIACKTPDVRALPRWCAAWSRKAHGKDLAADAAALLVDLVGPDMGRLDQELAKLAAYAGDARFVSARDVDDLVAQGRTEKIWTIFGHIGNGKVEEALGLVGRLLDHGEEPLRLLGAFSAQLRRLVQAARISERGRGLAIALEEAGVVPFGRRDAEQQLRHLGRARLNRVYEWLVEADIGMKSTDYLPARLLLERLVIQLARPTAATG